MKNENTGINIVTHNGAFHPDEIIACALVAISHDLEVRQLNITRTRATSVLVMAKTYGDLIIDVGAEYDGSQCFDHHQFEAEDTLWGKSSAGLIFDAYKDLLVNNHKLEKFIAHVDARDTRVGYDASNHHDQLCNLIVECNDINIMSGLQNNIFYRMVQHAVDYILALSNGKAPDLTKLKDQAKAAKAEKAEIYAERRAKRRYNPQGFMIAEYYPAWARDLNMGYPLFLSKGDGDNQLKVMVNTNLCIIEDISDKVFVHSQGFIGVTQGTSEVTVKTSIGEFAYTAGV